MHNTYCIALKTLGHKIGYNASYLRHRRLYMKNTPRQTHDSKPALPHIVSAIRSCLLYARSSIIGFSASLLIAASFAPSAMAQTLPDLPDEPEEIDVPTIRPEDLPKQELTYEITLYQILSDMALTRGQLETAYHGYIALAQNTRDPRYAEFAFMVAALANDTRAAVYAAELLETLAPNSTLGNVLVEEATLTNILKKNEAGKTQEAYDDIKKFLEKNPDNKTGLLFLSEFAHKLNKGDDIIYAYERLLKLDPNDAESMNNLGYFFADQNIRLDEAEKLIKKALKLKPEAPHIIDSAAWIDYRVGKLPEALKYARAAVAVSPDEPEAKMHLAEILWVSGERDEATQLFDELQSEINNKKDPMFSKLMETIKRLGVNIVNVAPKTP